MNNEKVKLLLNVILNNNKAILIYINTFIIRIQKEANMTNMTCIGVLTVLNEISVLEIKQRVLSCAL